MQKENQCKNTLIIGKNLADRRIAIVFGPVEDPKGVYGLAIIETEDETIGHDQ
jgi:hypothetical protein